MITGEASGLAQYFLQVLVNLLDFHKNPGFSAAFNPFHISDWISEHFSKNTFDRTNFLRKSTGLCQEWRLLRRLNVSVATPFHTFHRSTVLFFVDINEIHFR